MPNAGIRFGAETAEYAQEPVLMLGKSKRVPGVYGRRCLDGPCRIREEIRLIIVGDDDEERAEHGDGKRRPI